MLALVAVTTSAAAAPHSLSGPPSGAALPTMDALLNELRIPFNTSGSGFYTATVDFGENPFKVAFKVNEIAALNNGDMLTAVVMYIPLFNLAEGARPSAALVNKMLEIGGNLSMGRVGMVGNTIMFQSTFWLNEASTTSLMLQLEIGMMLAPAIGEQLRPFTT
jgi:hypothetical protein